MVWVVVPPPEPRHGSALGKSASTHGQSLAHSKRVNEGIRSWNQNTTTNGVEKCLDTSQPILGMLTIASLLAVKYPHLRHFH
jgi:hypothetical protein